MKLAVWIQSLKQIWGIIVLEYRYQGKLSGIEDSHSAVRYSLPFQGKWVVVNGGVAQAVSHSWELPTQRYAYDFIQLDASAQSCRGEETAPSSFYCYGQDILAPADGVVAAVGKGYPDSPTTADRDVACAARDIRGNHILLQHAPKEYALLAHLKPNSILVSVGQRVKRGEKIAQCGNSGNSAEPHLHFHLQAGKSFYTSPGIPIAFQNVTAVSAPNYERFDSREIPDLCKNTYPPYITRGQVVCNADITT